MKTILFGIVIAYPILFNTKAIEISPPFEVPNMEHISLKLTPSHIITNA